jgi:dipeptidyl aminopeptidase/acylaminoacyl peptidase
MVNWIAGQPFAKKFLTFVCHDGIFDNLNLVSSDETASTSIDMGGQIFDPSALANWDKYSPSRHTANWTQPMLHIHSDNDYRCPITEGLAAFNVCQLKGIESRFLNFPNECHFVQERANSLHWHKTVFGWVNKFTGNKDGVKLEPPASEPWKKSDVEEKVKKMEDMMDFLTEKLRGS